MNRKSILLPEGVTDELAEKLLAAVEAELAWTRIFSFQTPAKVITHHITTWEEENA